MRGGIRGAVSQSGGVTLASLGGELQVETGRMVLKVGRSEKVSQAGDIGAEI